MSAERSGPAVSDSSGNMGGKGDMIKAPDDLQDLRRKIYVCNPEHISASLISGIGPGGACQTLGAEALRFQFRFSGRWSLRDPYPPVANVWYRAMQSTHAVEQALGQLVAGQPITMLAQPQDGCTAC
jgi:hypothetical protein